MEKSNENSYVLKEAEKIVANYISKEEREKNKTHTNKSNKLKRKYKILKKYAIISTLILIISIFFNFV